MKKQPSLFKSLFFLALTFMVLPAFSQSTSLVGTWGLTAADKILPDGSRVADFGKSPRGIAIFTADGHYTVEIFQIDRINSSSAEHVKGEQDEYKDTLINLSCHFGTYTVDAAKGTITFHIDRASYTAWDSTTTVRTFTLEGDHLTWRVAPRADGSVPVSAFTRAH